MRQFELFDLGRRRGDLHRSPDIPEPRLMGGATDSVRCAMAYDADVADRVRELLADERDLTEKKMFGGLAFFVAGNMAVAASSQGGILVRVGPAESDKLTQTTTARFMEMRGREMRGWLRIDSGDVRTKRELAKWVALGTRYARSLPPKR